MEEAAVIPTTQKYVHVIHGLLDKTENLPKLQ